MLTTRPTRRSKITILILNLNLPIGVLKTSWSFWPSDWCLLILIMIMNIWVINIGKAIYFAALMWTHPNGRDWNRDRTERRISCLAALDFVLKKLFSFQWGIWTSPPHALATMWRLYAPYPLCRNCLNLPSQHSPKPNWGSLNTTTLLVKNNYFLILLSI